MRVMIQLMQKMSAVPVNAAVQILKTAATAHPAVMIVAGTDEKINRTR